MTTFNRITTGIEDAGAGRVRIFIRYWSTEHHESSEEHSRRTFDNPIEAERLAVKLAAQLRERL